MESSRSIEFRSWRCLDLNSRSGLVGMATGSGITGRMSLPILPENSGRGAKAGSNVIPTRALARSDLTSAHRAHAANGAMPATGPSTTLRALQPLPDVLKSSTTERVPALRRKGRTPQLAPAISPNVLRAARSDSDIAPSCQPARQPGNPPDESRSWPSQTRAADLPGRESGAFEYGVLPYGVLPYASRRSCMPF
jgi:hypothetical protein